MYFLRNFGQKPASFAVFNKQNLKKFLSLNDLVLRQKEKVSS